MNLPRGEVLHPGYVPPLLVKGVYPRAVGFERVAITESESIPAVEHARP